MLLPLLCSVFVGDCPLFCLKGVDRTVISSASAPRDFWQFSPKMILPPSSSAPELIHV